MKMKKTRDYLSLKNLHKSSTKKFGNQGAEKKIDDEIVYEEKKNNKALNIASVSQRFVF